LVHDMIPGPRYEQSENNYFTEMCSGSEAGSYLRLIDFVCHSTLGLRVIKKKKRYEQNMRVPVRRASSYANIIIYKLGFNQNYYTLL